MLLAQRELGLGLGERAERVLPVALQAAGDEPVLGLDLAVAALRPVGLVLGALELQPPLGERGVVVVLRALRPRASAAFTPAGVSAASSAPATAWSICAPPTRRHQLPRSSTRMLLGQ